ncbi:alpha/beta-hydrolase [Backusella circina FSU 941]|nr:alpha/beta-hydrolase [Backusella circina FSU 941]
MNIAYNNINHSIHLYGFENTTSPVIWLLHGAGGDHSHFDHVLPPLLEKKCRVIVSDVRLHGKSQPINKEVICEFDNQTLVNDVIYILNQIVDQYGGFTLYLAGFSMGALITQLFARSYLEAPSIESVKLGGIILIASCVVGLKWKRIGWINFFYNDTDTDQVAVAAKEGILMAPLNAYGREAAKRAADAVTSLENLSKIFRFCAKALTPLVDKPEFTTSTLDIPMLLIAPESDTYTKGELIYLNEHNKQHGIQSEVIVIRDAGHMVILDQGLLVGEAIARKFGSGFHDF